MRSRDHPLISLRLHKVTRRAAPRVSPRTCQPRHEQQKSKSTVLMLRIYSYDVYFPPPPNVNNTLRFVCHTDNLIFLFFCESTFLRCVEADRANPPNRKPPIHPSHQLHGAALRSGLVPPGRAGLVPAARAVPLTASRSWCTTSSLWWVAFCGVTQVLTRVHANVLRRTDGPVTSSCEWWWWWGRTEKEVFLSCPSNKPGNFTFLFLCSFQRSKYTLTAVGV